MISTSALPSTPGCTCPRALDDRGRLDADLDPDTTAVVETALRVFERPDREGELRTLAERRAESLRDLARYALDHHGTGGRPGRQHPHVSAVVDLPELWAGVLWGLGIRTEADLARFLTWRPVSVLEEGFLRHALAVVPGAGATVDGHRITAEALTTVFGPGTTIERIVTAEGRVLDHGRAVRLVTDSLRDAMLVRDLGVASPAATPRRHGSTATTSPTGTGAARPAWPTSPPCAPGTTGWCTEAVGP